MITLNHASIRNNVFSDHTWYMAAASKTISEVEKLKGLGSVGMYLHCSYMQVMNLFVAPCLWHMSSSKKVFKK